MSTSLSFVITGAARGIGRGLSRLLLQRGHRVLLLDNNEVELFHTREIFTKIFKNSSQFRCQLCNVRDPAAIKEAASTAKDMFTGKLDCLINNAAYTSAVGGTSLEDMTLEEWNASLETNLTAPMLLSQALLSMLKVSSPGVGAERSQGGSIIMMSSTRAHQSEPHSEGYATTKAGVIGMTHSMAVSLAPFAITVNAILPGWINVLNECKEADEKGTKRDEGLSREDHEWQLTGRVGKVEDILNAVEYIINAKGFVTGTEIVVSGGVERKMVYPEG